jgi:hypothetical protein
MEGKDGLKVKLEYKSIKIFEERVERVPFSDNYQSEKDRLTELKDIKPGKKGEEERLEMERLQDSIEAEEIRHETQQTQEAINAFYRGMEVQCPPALHN